MALLAIQRRVRRLEGVLVIDRLQGYPPLSSAEIETLAARMASGEEWTKIETLRVRRQCPYTQGELIIRAYGGEITIKRLVGIDMASV